MEGMPCFTGVALAGGILAVLLGLGWYGDRKPQPVKKRSNLTIMTG